MTLGFFAGQGLFPLLNVIIGSFLGMMTLDSFWFWVVRSKLAEKFKSWLEISSHYKTLETKIENLSGKNDVIVLLVSKILVGTRILVIAYISMRKLAYLKFLLFDGTATFLWAIILGYLGWLAGLGFYALSALKQGLTIIGLYLMAIIIIIYTGLWLIRRWVAKKQAPPP